MLFDFPDKDTEQWNEMLEELVWWDSLNAPDHHLGLASVVETPRVEEWLEDMEEELRKRKTGAMETL